MSAPVSAETTALRVEKIASTISPIIRELIATEDRRERAERQALIDAEIMKAAKELGRALDELQRAKFTAQEPGARIRLEKIAQRMRRVMEKHGRMP